MASVLEICRQIRLDAGPTKRCPGGYSIPAEHTCGGKKKSKAQPRAKKVDKPKPPKADAGRTRVERKEGEGPEVFLKAKYASPLNADRSWKPGYPLRQDQVDEVANAFLESLNIPRDRPTPMSANMAAQNGEPGRPVLGGDSQDSRGFQDIQGQKVVTIANGDFRNIARGENRTMIRAIDGPLQATTSTPGRAGMKFEGIERRNMELEESIASGTTPGKLWTTNAYRQKGRWEWASEPIETGGVNASRTDRTLVPAILSVTQTLKGQHIYCLDVDTGSSPGVLTIQPDKKDEPKNLIGGYGHVVLGKAVGVIRASNGQIHPVFDRVQISPPLTPDQPIISVSTEWNPNR